MRSVQSSEIAAPTCHVRQKSTVFVGLGLSAVGTERDGTAVATVVVEAIAVVVIPPPERPLERRRSRLLGTALDRHVRFVRFGSVDPNHPDGSLAAVVPHLQRVAVYDGLSDRGMCRFCLASRWSAYLAGCCFWHQCRGMGATRRRLRPRRSRSCPRAPGRAADLRSRRRLQIGTGSERRRRRNRQMQRSRQVQ